MFVSSSVVKQVELCQDAKTLEATFYYPKIIFVENKNTIHIVDLLNGEEDVIKLGEDVVDKANQGNFLWLILKSHQIKVIDVLSGSQMSVVVDGYKICKIIHDTTNMLLMSESGESYEIPYGTEQLMEKFKEGTPKEVANLTKSQIFKRALDIGVLNISSWNGLTILKNEDSKLLMKCPVTGLHESVSLSVPLQHAVCWDDLLVLAHDQNMWIVDCKGAEKLFEFENNGAKYYPVAVHKNALYYISWSHSQVITSFSN